MLRCSQVTVRYAVGELDVVPLRDLDLELAPGATALMGPSGSGKSTLLRVIAGLQEPLTGSVEIDAEPVTWSRRDPTVDPRVALVHQDYALVSFLDVADNLQLARELRGLPRATDTELLEALEVVGMADHARRMPRTLSGGQQQRVALARATVVHSKVLLADEPTGSLDSDNSAMVANLLRALGEDHGLVVLVATHDAAVAASLGRTVQLADLNAAEDDEPAA